MGLPDANVEACVDAGGNVANSEASATDEDSGEAHDDKVATLDPDHAETKPPPPIVSGSSTGSYGTRTMSQIHTGSAAKKLSTTAAAAVPQQCETATEVATRRASASTRSFYRPSSSASYRVSRWAEQYTQPPAVARCLCLSLFAFLFCVCTHARACTCLLPHVRTQQRPWGTSGRSRVWALNRARAEQPSSLWNRQRGARWQQCTILAQRY